LAPDYSHVVRVIYSGTCLCGHSWDDHHCQIVQDAAVAAILGTNYAPDVCEFYGCNEDAGLDEVGQPHCLLYCDREDPDLSRHALWRRKLGQ